MVSVVILTCERTELLAKCLRPLAHAAEIIVSDDGQSSSSRQLISNLFPRVKWISGPHRGPAANRNRGAHQATGEWLAFPDDDSIPDGSHRAPPLEL